MLIPNGSLLYDTEDKKLYTVPNITYTTDEGEIVTRRVDEWEKGNSLGNYTFNLVPKTYRFGFIPTQNPTIFEDVTNFATKETTDVIEAKIKKAFPEVVFSVIGEVFTPKNYNDAVKLYANNPSKSGTGTKEQNSVGLYAVLEAQHGTQVMLNYVRAGLINDGLL